MNPIAQLILAQAPEVIGFVKGLLQKRNPDAPVPTSEEVVLAFEKVFRDSFARDEFLKAALEAEIAAKTRPA